MKHAFMMGFFLCLITHVVRAQEFNFHSRFDGFFDNREYFNDYIQPQSVLGTRVWLDAGTSTDNNHNIQLGLTALYEFGSTGDRIVPEPVFYYSTHQKHHELYFGLFPRYKTIEVPRMLLNDTLLYFRPNVEGIFLKFKITKGYQNVWLDWTSRQTETRRETFLLGGTGRYNFGRLFYFHHFLMYHYAGPAVRVPDDQIRDNGGLITGLGYNFTPGTNFDTLYINTAFAASYDQHRSIYKMRFYGGSLTEINAQYKGFGINETFYIGDGQLQLMGDQFYTSEVYSRTDFFWKPYKKINNIDWKIQISVHCVPGSIDWSQIFVISYDFNKIWKSKARDFKNVVD